MKSSYDKSKSEILRQKAEDFLKKKSPTTVAYLSEADILKLVHELQVYQIELEMLNEELDAARSAAVSAAEKYLELYDYAPIGYIAISNLGNINEINQNGAKMLGKERLYLQGLRFGFFVSDDTKSIFNNFLDKVFYSKAVESCEVTLSAIGGSPIHVHLTGIAHKNGEQCLVTMSDISGYRLKQA